VSYSSKILGSPVETGLERARTKPVTGKEQTPVKVIILVVTETPALVINTTPVTETGYQVVVVSTVVLVKATTLTATTIISTKTPTPETGWVPSGFRPAQTGIETKTTHRMPILV
jgi:hypothetical protein